MHPGMFRRLPPCGVIILGVIMQKINEDKTALCDAIKALEYRGPPKYTSNLLKEMIENQDKLEKLYQGLEEALSMSDGEKFDALWEKHVSLVNPDSQDYFGQNIVFARHRCSEYDSLIA